MKLNLGGRPLEVTFAFIMAVTLLLPGVTSRSIVSTTTTSPNTENGLNTGNLVDETVSHEFELDPTYEEEYLTGPEGTVENIEAESYLNRTATNDEQEEDDALALFSLIVKEAIEEDAQEGMNDSTEAEPETSSVDEDNFSISDLPRLLKPLIDAFSDDSSSEAPQKDDFLSWFPSLKDLFEPNKPSESETTNSAARSGRRSSFSVVSESSLQPPPASPQPSEPEIFSSGPTITRPPVTITKPPVPSFTPPITITLPEYSDSDEDSETNF